MTNGGLIGRGLVVASLLGVASCRGSLSPGGPDAAAGSWGTGSGASGGAAGSAGGGAVGGGAGGGAVGGGVAGSGGGAAAVCGTHRAFVPEAWIDTLALADGTYDGPALVERSNEQDMVLTFTPAASDAGAPLPTHVTISRMNPMPRLPIGARVWLSKIRANDPWYAPQHWALSVRDRQGGKLLFGLSRNAPDEAFAPVKVGAPSLDGCIAPHPDTCAPGSFITYGTVPILGDRTVVVADSQPAVVPIDGIDYDVLATVQQATQPTRSPCADYYVESGVSLVVQARDMAALAAMLTIDPLPVCSDGNATEHVGMWASLANVTGRTYDGPVTFKSGTSPEPYLPQLLFTLDNLGGVTFLEIRVASAIFAAPDPGAKFWMTMRQSGVWALRAEQGGPVLLAGGSDGPDLSAELGIAVTVERRCEYGRWPQSSGGALVYLWDYVIGTSPPVRVSSGTAAPVQIAGRNYLAATAGRNGAGLSIYPR